MCLQQTESLVKYLMLTDLLVLFDKARLIFSEFYLVINASLALCLACKLLLKILFVGCYVRAGALMLIAHSSLRNHENHEHYSRSSLHLCTMVELSWGGIKCLLGFCLVLLKELNCVFPHEHCSREILEHWFLQLLLMFCTF